MKRKAVVAGATGLIGKELVHLLLKDSDYASVTLLVRRPTGLTHPKLHENVIDFNLLEHSDVILTEADVFCTLGTTIKKAGSQEAFRQVDYSYPMTLGRLAKSQSANQFLIVSSMGANPSSRLFYSRVKGEVEAALRELHLPTLQIFRPSLLLGDREEFRLGERVMGVIMPLFAGLLGKYRPIHAQTVAKAMIHAAKSEHAGVQVYESSQIARMKGE